MKTMKKYILMAVAGMLALSSCTNDDNDSQNAQKAPRQMTFTAGYDGGAQTRATLDGSTKKVSFDANDHISILSANNANADFTTSLGGATASFSGTATDDTKFYAVYPYNSNYALDGTKIKNVEIPYVQTNAAHNGSGWDKTAPIAYATTTNSSLTFKNACALLKIVNNVDDDITIVIDCDGKLTGTFDLDTSNGVLTASDDTYPQVYATEVPNNTTIYLAVAPGRVEYFMAIWQDTEGGYGSKTKEGAFTFEAGKIYDLGKTSEWTD